MAASLMLSSCGSKKNKEIDMQSFEKGTFGYDLNYLSEKDNLIVLKGEDGNAQIIVSAKYQGKVFTSTATGLSGNSLGFVNYKVFDSGVIDEHMNGYGGENRFWLGPEGGKYSVYFAPGAEQVFDNWHTPKPIDTEAWNIVSTGETEAVLEKEMQVNNYLGTMLHLNVVRKITLLEGAAACRLLGICHNPNLNMVAYTTDNMISNLNDFEWTRQTGTICIWMLDMFNPAPRAVTVIPFIEGNEKELGKIVTSDYFGEIPANRLKIKDNAIYLKTDGNYRSKLGLNNKRTKAIAGNYDPDSKRLTITTFDVDKNAVYLNQEWNPAKDPLKGDAMNAYNDGPLDDGSIMGPFLELESVSPAAFLKPGQSLNHVHNVFHFVGEEEDLNRVAEQLLGVSIQEIINIF
jgi:hypothetical protein